MVTITDRTELDVINNTPKGNYNVSDLNRVESNSKEIYEKLKQLGFVVPDLEFKTDWAELEPDTAYLRIDTYNWFSAINSMRYLTNIRKLAIIVSAEQLIDIPNTMEKLTFEGANNIEKALELIETLIRSFDLNWVRCKELYCGETPR